jgi:hypothetical protein
MVFNAGKHNEGVYTHTLQDQGTSILAFECPDDANRFGQLLLNKGFDAATPLKWSADRMAMFCRRAGLEVSMVPRGTQPTPPSERQHGTGKSGDPERRYPGDGSGRRDPYSSYRLWLETMFPLHPENCDNDDDCIIR